MRIVGGALGGRRIKAPPGRATRPTADRVREALFSILGPAPPQTSVLDAFAGAGALGLEALSRGAERALFIDESRAAVAVLRENVTTLGVADIAEIRCADALRVLRGPAPVMAPFRWVFCDPPYRSGLADRALAILGTGALLTGDAVVVVEHDRREAPAPEHRCLVRTDTRRYGDTELSFYRRESA